VQKKMQEQLTSRDQTLEGFLTPTTTGETCHCETTCLAWLLSWVERTVCNARWFPKLAGAG